MNSHILALPVVGSSLTTAAASMAGHSGLAFASLAAEAMLVSDRVYETSQCVVRLAITATGLHAASSSSSSSVPSPCVELFSLTRARGHSEPSWRLVHSSEVCPTTRTPRWRTIVLGIHALCANDYYLPLMVRVWDVPLSGSPPRFVGEAFTTLRELLTKTRFDLLAPHARSTATAAAAAAAFTALQPSAGSLTLTYARVFSDVKYSRVERERR